MAAEIDILESVHLKNLKDDGRILLQVLCFIHQYISISWYRNVNY